MGRTAGDTGALGEAVVFLDYFKDLPDPRQRGKVLYPLDEVLLLLAVLAGRRSPTSPGSARRNSSCCYYHQAHGPQLDLRGTRTASASSAKSPHETTGICG